MPLKKQFPELYFFSPRYHILIAEQKCLLNKTAVSLASKRSCL